jgi:fructose/tagatose bisphosphate aldolase
MNKNSTKTREGKMSLFKKMKRGISLVVSLTFCLNFALSNSIFAAGTMLKPNPAVKDSGIIEEIAGKDGGELLNTAKRLDLQPQTLSNFRDEEKQIAGPVLSPLQEFIGKVNSASLLYKIGFTYKDDSQDRAAQIELLLSEIDKELAKPGTGNLPKIKIISDYHGGVERFAALVSDALAEFAGFKGQLDPKVSIEQQLQAQGLSLKTMKGAIYLNGDLLDRGKSGIACFNIAKELSETAPDKVFYISGNHDLWAFLNLSGFHLPWYKGFKLYGDKEAEQYINTYQTRYPQYFNSPKALLWWTERLAEYNAIQEEFQKKALDGKAADIRKRFIEYYQKYSSEKKWTSTQLDAMENFIGHFARIDVPDPFVGLNGLGKTSVVWWKDLQQQLMKGREARSNTGAEAAELAAWKEAIEIAEKISQELEVRAQQARDQISDKWWYLVLQAINNNAYKSVEWWAKDWSSHKDWGESVIKELNAMIKDQSINDPLIVKDREEFKDDKEITQANYMRSYKLQDLAAFYKNNFNLGLRTPYGDLITHGLLPIKNNNVAITYKDKTYKGKKIFEVLRLISTEVKESKDPGSIWEALNLVNSWYADATTIAKPKFVKELLTKIAPVLSKLGVRNWAFGHNPVNKVKAPVISRDSKDNRFAVVQLDLGMAPKFGGTGGYVTIGSDGIVLRGFETDKTDEAIKESPDTIIPGKKEGEKPTIVKNPGMSAKKYLSIAKAALKEEFEQFKSKSLAPVLASKPVKAEESRAFYDKVAKQGKVIVMSTNTRSKYVMEGIFQGAKETNAPVIIQRSISEFVKGYTPADLARDAQEAADKVGYTGDWLLKLDHGTIGEDNEASVQKVIKYVNDAKAAGFASFSIDASKLVNFKAATEDEQQKRNYEVTARIVKETGVENFAWEGEIGEIVGDHNALSTKAEAVAFIEGIVRLGVRPPVFLAINNGSEHGNVPGMKISLERTKEISDALYDRWGIHINQHGITGTELSFFPQLAAVRILNGNVGTHWQNYMWDVINKMQPEVVAKAIEELKLDKYRSKNWDKQIRNFEPQLAGLLKPETMAAITEAVYETAVEHYTAFGSKSPSLVVEPAFSSALIVDPGLLSAGGVTELLKGIAQLKDQAVVFYGPGAGAMKILANEGLNILVADNEAQAAEQLIKEKGIAPDNIKLITTVFKDELKNTGIRQKIVSADDAMSVMFGLTKAAMENHPSPESRVALAKLYSDVENAGAIPANLKAEKAKILALAIGITETVEIKSMVKRTEQQTKIITEVATKIGV